MPFIVVYDSNVLYPNTLRDLLIRLAQSGIVQAKWTDRILDEVFDNIGKNRPDIDPDKLALLRQKMNGAVADVLVTGYEQTTSFWTRSVWTPKSSTRACSRSSTRGSGVRRPWRTYSRNSSEAA